MFGDIISKNHSTVRKVMSVFYLGAIRSLSEIRPQCSHECVRHDLYVLSECCLPNCGLNFEGPISLNDIYRRIRNWHKLLSRGSRNHRFSYEGGTGEMWIWGIYFSRVSECFQGWCPHSFWTCNVKNIAWFRIGLVYKSKFGLTLAKCDLDFVCVGRSLVQIMCFKLSGTELT